MEIGLHAIALIVVIPMCCWFAAVYGQRPESGQEVARRAVFAILAGTLAYIVPVSAFACLCGAGNTPWREPTLAATGAVICCLALRKPNQRRYSALGMFVVSLALSAHFDRLALPAPGRREHCRYTGDPDFAGASCDHPGEVKAKWYTPITGLYSVADARSTVIGASPTPARDVRDGHR